MRFSVISAFPGFFEPFFDTGIVGRAVRRGLVGYDLLNPRDFAEGPHGQIDDYAYGGGGMVMMAEPIARAIEAAGVADAKVVMLSPQGRELDQALVEELAEWDHLILLCGRYEGVDERLVESCVDMEVSIGDFVLSGGEIPAMALMDAVSRCVAGVVGKEEAVEEDSFYRGMLDTPHYTRPFEWRGKSVPAVLASGDHGAVDAWRRQEAARRTLERRPDLLGAADIRPYVRKGIYALFHAADLGQGETDRLILALAGDAAAMGCSRVFVVSPEDGGEAARSFVKRVKERHNDRSGSGFLKAADGLKPAFGWVSKKEKKGPAVVCVGCWRGGRCNCLARVKRLALEEERPVVFCFGRFQDDSVEEPFCFVGEEPVSNPVGESLSLHGSMVAVFERFFGNFR